MKCFVVVLALCFSAVSSLALNREAFTFTKYDLNVRLEPEQQRLAVRGAITLRNDSSSPQKNAALEISSSLTWRSVEAAGKLLQFVSQPYESDIDHTGELSEVIVTLPQAVAPGGTVEVNIGYEGVILLDATRLTRIGVPKETAIHSDWDQISKASTAVRGVGHVAWYPVAMEAGNLSEGNSLLEVLGRWKTRERDATMKLRFEDPTLTTEAARPTVICDGKEMRDITRNASLTCFYEPLGSSAPTFASGEYQTLDHATVEIMHLPEHRANADRFVQAADAVAPFVKAWFGAPREKARVVELSEPGAAPFESGSMLLTPLNDTDPKLLQIALVHTLTHAAFASPRAWIYEGLAYFAQAAYREQQESRRPALDLLGLHRAALVEAERELPAQAKDAPPQPEESLIATAVDEFYRSKAAYGWWMLRDLIGEDVLKSVLAAYQPDQDTEPSYLQQLVRAHSKRDLEWFFDDWVYHDRGLPDFRVESAYARQASQGNYLVTVTIENLGGAGAEVPVIVHFDGGETTERVEVRGKAKGVIRVATPKPPTEIVVNDGSVPERDMSNNVFKVAGAAR